ncbi:hypothetical protein SK3146_03810 [Paenibacillus konkukensis]|uniref:Replication protein n=1 Tax=Paenibacillus konkukensis TaxID=2020716 RepID=A0ABY4RQT3_9BACL|nr:hypothetical protein [Paenibacillus konkukensis]UQZ84555.1 hypothetical protein SK3146_03810 [Paenibacillus konkukensis]
MIDTVKFDILVNLTEAQIDQVSWTEVKKTMKRKMVTCELFDQHDDTQPRLVYKYKEDDPQRAWLKLELSAPRYLYGSNVYELRQVDVEPLFRKLRRYIAGKLQIPLSQVPQYSNWEVEKLHICKNFNAGRHMQDYLNLLSGIQKPGGYKAVPYRAAGSNNLESVVYQRNTKKNRSIHKFYDKRAEVDQKSAYQNKSLHQQDAEGLLRYEVELTYEEMKKFSPTRRAIELLTPQTAVKVLQDGLNSLGLTKPIKHSSIRSMHDAINRTSLNIRTKSMLIAFLSELQLNGKGYCKTKYQKTTYYDNYNKLKEVLGMDEILFSEVDLPPLKVHKDSFKNKKSRSTSGQAGETTTN